ncbi:MAG: hypothetical protein JWN75_773 [Candidatus Saccharibacteria bacterium]|nr:hypothetical protein [Candidatus Saccharibacteria bacterium]
MSTEKQPFLIRHREEIRRGKRMNVTVLLLQQTVDNLGGEEMARMRAESMICRTFTRIAKVKYGEEIDVTIDDLFTPEPQPGATPSNGTFSTYM